MSGKTAPINIVQLQFLYHQYMIVDVRKKVDVISCIIYRYFPATHVLPAGTWFALSLWQKLVAFRLFMESMALLRSRATRRWSRQFSTPVRHATSGSTPLKIQPAPNLSLQPDFKAASLKTKIVTSPKTKLLALIWS